MSNILLEQLALVNSKEDLSNFASALAQDFKLNSDEWENQNILSFLEAMSAWIMDMDGFYKNNEKEFPENVPWKIFADILFSAKNYE